MTDLAPVALFVYARQRHTQRTIEALKSDTLAGQTDLHVFADGGREQQDQKDVMAVREYVRGIDTFRSVTIHERTENYGLAQNIVDGVNATCMRYGRAIILEDDLVTSPYFLSFMNQALDRYENEPKVWHVNAWHFPISARRLDDIFFSRWMNCWGWATWSDRWQHFAKDPDRLIRDWSPEQIDAFNLDGVRPSTWRQVVQNAERRINTWAVFWHATIFENGGLCVNPARSLVENIGFDGTGENCGTASLPQRLDSEKRQWRFSNKFEESTHARELIKLYLRRREYLVTRAINKFTRMAFNRAIY